MNRSEEFSQSVSREPVKTRQAGIENFNLKALTQGPPEAPVKV
jgi:hypothetical protein